MSSFNKEQGTIGFWAKNSLPQPYTYWKLNETTAGSVIDYGFFTLHGSNNGATINQDGYRGKCYDFNGTSSYISVGDTQSDIRTVAFWMKADNTSKDIIDLDGGTHSVEVTAGVLSATGFVSPNIYINGVRSTSVDTSWVFVVVTTSTAIYASNVQIGTETTFFDGKLQHIALYQGSLTEDEVKQLYQDTRYIVSADSTPTPIHWFPLDKYYVEDVGLRLVSGPYSNGAELRTDNYRKHYYFNADNIELSTDDGILERTDKFTINAWVWVDTSAGDFRIVKKLSGAEGYAVDLLAVTATEFILSFYMAGPSSSATITSSMDADGYVYSDGWNMLTVTNDGTGDHTGIRFYCNGSVLKIGTATGDLSQSIKSTVPFYVGTIGVGKISDLRIYLAQLTVEQLQLVMDERESFELKIDEKTSLIKGSVNESDTESSMTLPDLSSWYHIGITWLQQNITNAANLVLWNKLGSTIESGSSEVGSNFTEVGTPVYASGKFNNGFNSTNSANYLTVTFPVLQPTQGCMEVWLRPHFIPSNATPYQVTTVTDGGTASSANWRGPLLYWRDATFKWSFLWADGTDRYCDSNHAGFDAAEDLVHVACVWDQAGIDGSSDTMRIYINNMLKGTVTSAITVSSDYTDLYLGKEPAVYPSRIANAVIDNIKIWSQVKTDFSDRFYEAPQEVVNKLYLSGQKQAESTSSGLVKKPARQALFGSDNVKGRQSNLLYDRIYIGRRQLSDLEMYNLYASKYLK